MAAMPQYWCFRLRIGAERGIAAFGRVSEEHLSEVETIMIWDEF